MPHMRRIETTMAAWSLVAGLAANFAGFMLIGRLPWPLSLALVALGTAGLIGAMVLISAADRNRGTLAPPPNAISPN
jgi:hypothetical protein